jgi:hypothetical protein
LAAALAAGCGDAPEPAASDPPPPARESVDGRFVPATHRAGDRVLMPVEFTDGSRVVLGYPPRLALAELGVVPYGSATLHGDSPAPGRSDHVGRDFLVRYGHVEQWLAGAKLIGRYGGAARSVGFWSGGPRGPDTNHLAFQFGPWALLVYDFTDAFDGGAASMTDAERAAWAQSFQGGETPGGFLRLAASGPLRLARAGEHAGPALAFGSLGSGPWFQLALSYCEARGVS